MRYQDSIYNSAGNMGKAGAKARRAHLRQQALEKALRDLVLPASNPITKPNTKPADVPTPTV
jgi:hypothetical protein